MTKNKIITLVFVVLAIVSLALIYIFRIRKNNKSIPVTEGVAVVPTFDDEISSDSSYCATFQLVWNDMKNEIIKKDIVFKVLRRQDPDRDFSRNRTFAGPGFAARKKCVKEYQKQSIILKAKRFSTQTYKNR